MTSQDFIDQLEVVHDALMENNQEAVAEAVLPLMDELESFEDVEIRRQNVAASRHVTGAEGDEADEGRVFGLQNMQVNMFREQILMVLVQYMTADEADAAHAEMIAEHIRELSDEEETLRQQESEIGTDLDAEQSGAMLSIGRIDQEEAITGDTLDSNVVVTVKNIGNGSGDASLVTMSEQSVDVDDELIELSTISPGDSVTADVSFTVDEPVSESLDFYLIPTGDQEPDEMDFEEWEEYVLLSAMDSFDFLLEVERPEEYQASPVIERGLSHRFTNPRDREDYATIGATAGGAMTAAGYGAYRKFFISDEDPSPDSEASSPDGENVDNEGEETSPGEQADSPDDEADSSDPSDK